MAGRTCQLWKFGWSFGFFIELINKKSMVNSRKLSEMIENNRTIVENDRELSKTNVNLNNLKNLK